MDKWYSLSVSETEKILGTNAASGLTRKAARSRVRKNGENDFFYVEYRSFWSCLRAVFAMKVHGGGDVQIGYAVAGQYDEGFVQKSGDTAHAAGGAEGRFFDRIVQRDAEVIAVYGQNTCQED